MKKRKLITKVLCIAGLFTVSMCSLASAKLECHPGYIQIVNGGYMPPSYGGHSFICDNTSECGDSLRESCDIVRNSSWAKYECSKCGSTSIYNSDSISHINPHCPNN